MSQTQAAMEEAVAVEHCADQPGDGQMSTQDLLAAYKQTGDEKLKWELILRYEGYIKRMALQVRGIYSHFAQVDDVINEGVLTLASAIDKYDPDKGVKFETYVAKRIRGMVIDMARKQDWMPRNLRKRTKEIDQAVTELYYELGRYPSDAEVAERLGISPEKYQKEAAGVVFGNVLSLDAMMDMYGSESRGADLTDKGAAGQPEDAYQERELYETLAKGISTLKKNEQIVLSLYYEKNLHMKEIAQVMEVSAPRVSQIHACAIGKLQAYMNEYMNGSAAPDNRKRKRG